MWQARVDLRVEDHADPVGELRRLLGLQRAYELAGDADELMGEGSPDAAATKYVRASELAPQSDELTIPVELAGTTKMVPRSAVQWVEAQGDYARLHTTDGSHLVRVSLASLADRWAEAGFVRIHRSYLVQLRLIGELRRSSGGYVVVVGGRELPVSRRHTRELKDRLVRAAKQAWSR